MMLDFKKKRYEYSIEDNLKIDAKSVDAHKGRIVQFKLQSVVNTTGRGYFFSRIDRIMNRFHNNIVFEIEGIVAFEDILELTLLKEVIK